MGVVFDKVTGLGKGGGTRGIFLSNYTDSRRTIETRIRGSLDLSACLRMGRCEIGWGGER